jgi:hypothetical protein
VECTSPSATSMECIIIIFWLCTVGIFHVSFTLQQIYTLPYTLLRYYRSLLICLKGGVWISSTLQLIETFLGWNPHEDENATWMLTVLHTNIIMLIKNFCCFFIVVCFCKYRSSCLRNLAGWLYTITSQFILGRFSLVQLIFFLIQTHCMYRSLFIGFQ